jgi:hypothetical protein
MAGIPSRNENRAASARFQPSNREAVRVLPERRPRDHGQGLGQPHPEPIKGTDLVQIPAPAAQLLSQSQQQGHHHRHHGNRMQAAQGGVVVIGKDFDRQAHHHDRQGAQGDGHRRDGLRVRSSRRGSTPGPRPEPPAADPARRRRSPPRCCPAGWWPSTATPGSPQPNTTGTTLRWAELLIGRNSVSPWTTPRTR